MSWVVYSGHANRITRRKRTVTSSCSRPLTILQYVKPTRDPQNLLLVPRPIYSGTVTQTLVLLHCHFIKLDKWRIRPARWGRMEHTIPSVTISTAATDNSIEYMNNNITMAVVLGWSEGSTVKGRFAPTGIKKGYTDLYISFGMFPTRLRMYLFLLLRR